MNNSKNVGEIGKTILSGLARKVVESAIGAAVWTAVGKKVGQFMDKNSKQENCCNKNDQVRVETPSEDQSKISL